MNNLNNQLTELKLRKKSLKYLLKVNFNTQEEYDVFKAEKISEFNELKELNEEIRDLEWQLLSPKEQQELLDYYEKIKEKYSDK